MRTLLIIFLTFCFGFVFSQDTIYVTSRSDNRLKSYEDSLKSYNVGFSVCQNLAKIFREMVGSNYDDYFF